MRPAALTKSTYTRSDTQHAPGGSHMGLALTRANLVNGTLLQRLDPVAYPQLGISYAGTVDGKAYPVAAKVATTK